MLKKNIVNRRKFLNITGKTLIGGSSALLLSGVNLNSCSPLNKNRPNILLILTDDQGYGDLGYHGNTKINTPNLDRFAKESLEFTRFYVCPVCSPTRSSLMTGRYNYRTGVVDTFMGRSMMYSDEVTIAEIFSASGYRNGIFGKWHLGDNYPMRPSDQGFQESLIHKGGGIGQPADPPGNMYTDPILEYNNTAKQYSGYCTDIFTDAAIQFIEKDDARPFFAYLSTNAPHTPLQIGEEYVKPYRAMDLDDSTARTYGMISNIDENVGRLLLKLKKLNIEENTIVIFMTDNGPRMRMDDPERYNSGLRGSKTTVYDGGIRVPFFIRFPGITVAEKKVDRIAGHIDILPTLLDACNIKKPEETAMDGVSLMPLLLKDNIEWQDRNLFFQWHRGDEPQVNRNCAVVSQHYKLVQPYGGNLPYEGDDLEKYLSDPIFELYDIEADPGERNNIADKYPDIVARMRKNYENWFNDVSSTRGYDLPRIYIGSSYENPVILTRQDWRGPKASWRRDGLGYWEVKITKTGNYKITLQFRAVQTTGKAHIRIDNLHLIKPVEKDASSCSFDPVSLEAKDAKLEAWLELEEELVGVYYVYVEH